MLSIEKVEAESLMQNWSNNGYDWGESKQDFFDDEEMDDIENKKNLWDD